MKKIEINYEEVRRLHREEDNCLWDIWFTYQPPVKFVTFRRRYYEYCATGHESLMMITSDVNMDYEGGLWSLIRESADEKPEMNGDYDRGQDIEYILNKMAKGGIAREEIFDDPNDREAIIDELRAAGYNIEYSSETDKYAFTTYVAPSEPAMNFSKDKHFKIGVVSDTHIGSKYSDIRFLERLYNKYEELGVKDVYHCGDICDGMYPNRGDQIYELADIGADAQVERVVTTYPKKEGITTHFITGNHDHTFIRNTGYNIGPAIALRRGDMKYLGHNNALVYLTPNCIMEVNHPGDGSAYALSYSIQKMCDAYSGGDKPNILLNGHHHKFMQMFYRNIHAFEVPTTQQQTAFMKSKRLAAHVGGLILDIHVDDEGTITRIACELIPNY